MPATVTTVSSCAYCPLGVTSGLRPREYVLSTNEARLVPVSVRVRQLGLVERADPLQ